MSIRITNSPVLAAVLVVSTMGCYGSSPYTLKLADGSMSVQIPAKWHWEKLRSFEAVWYTLKKGQSPQVVIYMGNNPDIARIRAGKASRKVIINGNRATEYFVGKILHDVLIEPRCGHDRYVWLTRGSTVADAAVDAVMMAAFCNHRGR